MASIFSPDILSMLTQKFERNKDRNLQAATAEREFKDRHNTRLLKKMLAEQDAGVSERNAERAARADMHRTNVGSYTDLEEARLKHGEGAASDVGGMNPLDDARRKLLESQTATEEAERGPKVGALKALEEQRRGSGQKNIEQAKQIAKITDAKVARTQAQALRAAAQAETEPARRQQLLSLAELADTKANDLAQTLPSRIDVNEAKAALDTVKGEDIVATRTARLESMAAQAAKDLAAGGLSDARKKEIEQLTPGRIAAMQKALEAVDQQMSESRARITNKVIQNQADKMKREFDERVFNFGQQKSAQRFIMDLVKLQSKVDPEFGGLVVEENPGLQQTIMAMQAYILEGLPKDLKQTAKQALLNERGELIKKGGGKVDSDMEKRAQALLERLRAAKRK